MSKQVRRTYGLRHTLADSPAILDSSVSQATSKRTRRREAMLSATIARQFGR